MSDLFADTPFAEPSADLTFAGSDLYRLSENRAADCIEKALADPATRALLFTGGRVMVSFAGAETNAFFAVTDFEGIEVDEENVVLLGHDDCGALVAIRLPEGDDGKPADAVGDVKAIDCRSLALQGLLPAPVLGHVALGAALLAWHASHRFCGRCGGRCRSADGGFRRVCSQCGAEHFPRTDPVVIMLVVDGEHCLLGRGKQFAEGMYSALAGFVEPGETIEAAVRRETHEEAGIKIGKVRYHASQPWPFPHSLMIGCFAEALSRTIDMDRQELADCRWFSRGEILKALDSPGAQGFFVPPKMAIAHHLIARWARRQ